MNRTSREAFLQAWREDSAFRARVGENPKAALAEKGFDMAGAPEVRVAVDTPDTVHVVFPPAPDGALSDLDMERVSGGVPPPRIWGSDGQFLGYTSENPPA